MDAGQQEAAEVREFIDKLDLSPRQRSVVRMVATELFSVALTRMVAARHAGMIDDETPRLTCAALAVATKLGETCRVSVETELAAR